MTHVEPAIRALVAEKPAPYPSSHLARARIATSMLFLVDGTVFGTWAALIPSFQDRFVLSAGQLSWALVGIVIGAMVSMPVAGQLTFGLGSKRICVAAGLAFPGCLLALMLAPNFGFLIAAATLFGVCKGLMDISINAQGIAVETRLANRSSPRSTDSGASVDWQRPLR